MNNSKTANQQLSNYCLKVMIDPAAVHPYICIAGPMDGNISPGADQLEIVED